MQIGRKFNIVWAAACGFLVIAELQIGFGNSSA